MDVNKLGKIEGNTRSAIGESEQGIINNLFLDLVKKSHMGMIWKNSLKVGTIMS